MAKDWDNLIILDACRYDYFKDLCRIEGNLSKEVSTDVHTWGFMSSNFQGEELYDTVYVTANPQTVKLDDGIFHSVVPVYSNWDSEWGTVFPKDVTEASTKALDKFSNKRLIIHYMQPHTPYIGQKAREIREQTGVTFKGWGRNMDVEREGESTFSLVKNSNITKEDIQEAYSESLEIVLEECEELLEELNGKTVITADHGELLGDRPFYFRTELFGHPHHLHTPELRNVPWLETPHRERREIVSEPPIQEGVEYEEKIDEKLSALGYKP